MGILVDTTTQDFRPSGCHPHRSLRLFLDRTHQTLGFVSGSVDILVLGYWVVGGAIVGAVLGLLFPRVITIILYPVAAIATGISN